MAVNEKIRIKIKGYEHAVVDAAAAKAEAFTSAFLILFFLVISIVF